MKYILGLLFLIAPLAAQEPAKPQEPPAESAPTPAPPETAVPADQAAAADASPAPDVERVFSGIVDVGYRWTSDVGGSFNTYRSVVNLGDGPKLFNFDFSINDPRKKLWDNLNVFGANWGDPYNVLRVMANKQRFYRFSADYRNLTYFDFLPSFANPRIQEGILLNQRSYDTHLRTSDIYLELLPTRKIVPYFSYLRNSWHGSGITPYVASSNEYPIRNDVDDFTNRYLGGVRFEFDRWHITLEQGATTFENNQRVFSTDPNSGNRTVPILGQNLTLTNATEAYRIRGDGPFTRAIFTANPVSWANVQGQFLFSQPHTTVDYSEDATGNFILLTAARFFNRQSLLASGEATRPHTTGTFSAELRPLRRLRIFQSFTTDRFHNASDILLTEQMFFASSPEELQRTLSADRLVLNYNQEETTAIFDVTNRFSLRGGYRYVWGDAKVRSGFLGSSPLEPASLKRHVGLAGGRYRFSTKLTINSDFEASNGVSTYFRTSLQDYVRFRLLGRYQVLPSLALTGNVSVLSNQNPAPTVNYDFLARQQTLGVFWTPQNGARVSVLAEYSRATVRSNISYVVPSTLERASSFYRDNAHTGLAVVNLTMPKVQGVAPVISFGGSFFISSGSRPTNYYQPLGRFIIPLRRKVNWYAEWRWYGLSQDFYVYEGFRTHHFITGFRLIL